MYRIAISLKVLFLGLKSTGFLEDSNKEWSIKLKKLKDIFINIGINYKLGKFEAIYLRAKQIVNN